MADNSHQESNTDGFDSKKQGTRVFKKSCPNGKITTYLGKRDFIDHLTHVDLIDGVVLLDPEYLDQRKVFVHVLAAFRYGREDLDVLGLTFRKDLYLMTQQVYPPVDDKQRPLTRLQERLIKKLNSNAYPFHFELPHNTPASVTLQPGPSDSGKPCGVDYELKTYVADTADDKPHKRNSVRLAIRKLTYAPEQPAPQPSAEIVKEFIMSPGTLKMEATLDKEKYYHGESISVNVLIDNNSNKTVKKIKISVIQVADIMLFSRAVYKCAVDEKDSEEGFPIHGSQTGWCKVYRVCPLLANNRDKRGLALDGKLKHEDTNLASSTILRDNVQKESLGIIVTYKVKIRLILGFGTSDVCLELPFTLTHPKPPDDEVISLPEKPLKETATTPSGDKAESNHKQSTNDSVVDTEPAISNDLINFDNAEEVASEEKPQSRAVNETDDDLVFEDFARLRLNRDVDGIV